MVLSVSATIFASAADSLTWQGNRVDADIKSLNLPALLEQIATATGWQVYLEPSTTHNTSAKFRNLPPGEALHLLLGDLSFALVPQTNASPRLFVFRTAQGNATRLIRPATSKTGNQHAKRISNELIVRLKPGAKIDDLARSLGAKVIGRLDALNTYRLEFTDEAAAQAARDALLNNPDVAAVEYNSSISTPPPPQLFPGGAAPALTLKPKDNTGPCQIIVGLIDTPVSLPGGAMNSFVMSPVSIAGASPSPGDGLTHGTAMIQTILQSVQATTHGTSSMKILPVNVYGANPTTTTFDVGQGIYQAVNAGANIINLSLGGSGDSPFLHNLISSASQQGVIFFGAAGNEPVTAPEYPAAYPEVLAVTASGPNGQLATYANRGSFVSLIAPGSSVVDFQGQSYLVSGTSTATAYVSGLAAGMADSAHDCPGQIISSLRSQLGFQPAAGQ